MVHTGSAVTLLPVIVFHGGAEQGSGLRSEGHLSSWAGKTWGTNNQMGL